MFYYESPQIILPKHESKPSIFLAGGITGCENWQLELRDRLINSELLLLNPRREKFPMDDPNTAQAQIAWEHAMLRRASAISFWFPAETLCPIVLFELGAWTYASRTSGFVNGCANVVRKPLFVGVHPDYARRQDVEIQLSLQRPEIEIVYDLASLAAQIEKWEETL